jgi:ParB family chromosome partitioning protein
MAQRKTGAARPAAASRRRLGRGLESLMSAPVEIDINPAAAPAAKALEEKPIPSTPGAAAAVDGGDPAIGVQLLRTEAIHASPHQPRRTFEPGAIEKLAQSIKREGLMQPLVVRPGRTGGFELIAGERRWRAIQRLGLAQVPAMVRDVDDRAAAEMSLIENLQREDLNAIEQADAFRRLVDEFGLTHEEIARHVGLDRSSVSNHLRLCELDEPTRDAVRSGALTMGHGRALLALTNIRDRQQLAGLAMRQDWSVRELERRIRVRQELPTSTSVEPSRRRALASDLERRLGAHLGTKVQIHGGRKKGVGKVTIAYYSLDEFDGLMRRMGFDVNET